MKKTYSDAAKRYFYGEVKESSDNKDLHGNKPVTEQKRRIQDVEADKQLRDDFDYLEE